MTEQKLAGIAAAQGIALGPVFLIQEQTLGIERQQVDDPEHEIERLSNALTQATQEIKALRDKAASETSPDEAAIFDAQCMFLQDPALIDPTRAMIRVQRITAEAAWEEAVSLQVQQLLALENEYMRERSVDLRDAGLRVCRILIGVEEVDLGSLDQPSIILARDLTPSDMIRLDKDLVVAFCTAEGGPTSHVAILARSFGIPAVVGLGSELLDIDHSAELAVDGDQGLVVIDPSDETRRKMLQLRDRAETQRAQVWEHAQEPATTMDGRRIEVVANIGRSDEAMPALQAGAEGVGLLRTEFLYLERSSAPSEEEQNEAYRSILDCMGDRRVIVRTLDVGGDKDLPYMELSPEDNPCLGLRALRLFLKNPDLMDAQLRSLLRASHGHDVHIMFPMVSTLAELRAAKKSVEAAREAVRAEGYQVDEQIPIGIMVEVPSVAVMADKFAREADFFSIGTNDLTQYTFAAERTNPQVSYLTDACHPAILRLIHQVVDAAHGAGIWVGICGEQAGDPDAIPILLGLELDELSMAANSIPRAKSIIRAWDFASASKLGAKALQMEDASEVRLLVRSHQRQPAAG